MHTTTYLDNYNGPITARFEPKVRALFISEGQTGTLSISASDAGLCERLRLAAAAINGELDKAIESAFRAGFAAGMDADDRPFESQAAEAWADERSVVMRPTPPTREDEFDPTATGGRAEGGA